MSSLQDFLSFKLGDDSYAIALSWITEIKGLENVKIISKLEGPEFLLGIAKIIEDIVPIIDLRILYKSIKPMPVQFSVVVIIGFEGKHLGLVVDEVMDLIKLHADQIKEPPIYYAEKYINGIATELNRIFMVIDITSLCQSVVPSSLA